MGLRMTEEGMQSGIVATFLGLIAKKGDLIENPFNAIKKMRQVLNLSWLQQKLTAMKGSFALESQLHQRLLLRQNAILLNIDYLGA